MLKKLHCKLKTLFKFQHIIRIKTLNVMLNKEVIHVYVLYYLQLGIYHEIL
jgi:hypothetical protein